METERQQTRKRLSVVRCFVNLTEQQVRDLDAEAEKAFTNRSSIARQAVAEYLARRQKKEGAAA